MIRGKNFTWFLYDFVYFKYSVFETFWIMTVYSSQITMIDHVLRHTEKTDDTHMKMCRIVLCSLSKVLRNRTNISIIIQINKTTIWDNFFLNLNKNKIITYSKTITERSLIRHNRNYLLLWLISSTYSMYRNSNQRWVISFRCSKGKFVCVYFNIQFLLKSFKVNWNDSVS